MTVPINRLKLMAFASGAAIAGLAGSMFASFQLGVYPLNFQVQFLIVVYAALILGGSGSLSGAVLGGVVVAVMLDLLRDPGQASAAFYGVIAVTLIAKITPVEAPRRDCRRRRRPRLRGQRDSRRRSGRAGSRAKW